MDCLQYCQSAYQPINSSLVDFSQPAVTASLSSLCPQPFRPADEQSDLRQRDLVGVCVALDVEDEGVFVGVMLDDVIVHVHQDPDTKKKQTPLSFHAHHTRLQIGLTLQSASSLTLFYSSCTLWLSSPWARRTSLISTSDKWKRFVNRCSAANKLCLWLSLSHERHHSQHPSGPWAWETSASERQTPRPSPFLRTTALQREEEEQTFNCYSYSIGLYTLYACVWSVYSATLKFNLNMCGNHDKYHHEWPDYKKSLLKNII